MRKKRSENPAASEATLDETLRAKIAARAYELYEARGRVDGFELDDWLQAEREILAALQNDKPTKRRRTRPLTRSGQARPSAERKR